MHRSLALSFSRLPPLPSPARGTKNGAHNCGRSTARRMSRSNKLSRKPSENIRTKSPGLTSEKGCRQRRHEEITYRNMTCEVQSHTLVASNIAGALPNHCQQGEPARQHNHEPSNIRNPLLPVTCLRPSPNCLERVQLAASRGVQGQVLETVAQNRWQPRGGGGGPAHPSSTHTAKRKVAQSFSPECR